MKSDRVQILEDLCKSCSEHFTHLFARFSAIDTKAQGAATISGVLLGATLAFLPQPLLKETVQRYPDVGPFFSTGSFVTAVLTIGCSLWVLAVRPFHQPFGSAKRVRTATDLAQLKDDLSEDQIANYYTAIIEDWKASLESISRALDSKATFLSASQLSLAALIVFVAVFLGLASDTLFHR